MTIAVESNPDKQKNILLLFLLSIFYLKCEHNYFEHKNVCITSTIIVLLGQYKVWYSRSSPHLTTLFSFWSVCRYRLILSQIEIITSSRDALVYYIILGSVTWYADTYIIIILQITKVYYILNMFHVHFIIHILVPSESWK